tara:strand:- start:932 stop:1243 length:312 start_codon:yes stop_codon:yes gene_type:complete
MSVSIRGLKQTRSMSNNTNHFGSLSGLPSRVGVRVQLRIMPDYGLHCMAKQDGDKCCCLPISHTWHMKPAQARAYLRSKNLLNGTFNQVCSGGVGNRCVSGHC